MTGKGKAISPYSFDGCLAEWSTKEMQLTRLHEEILSRREALLNCSVAYHQSQDARAKQGSSNSEQAYIRNHKLLQDIKGSEERLHEDIHSQITPRFMTLQKNYWAMVKSQLPMWEQDMGMERPKAKGQSSTQGQSSRQRRSKKPQKQDRRSKSPK